MPMTKGKVLGRYFSGKENGEAILRKVNQADRECSQMKMEGKQWENGNRDVCWKIELLSNDNDR